MKLLASVLIKNAGGVGGGCRNMVQWGRDATIAPVTAG